MWSDKTDLRPKIGLGFRLGLHTVVLVLDLYTMVLVLQVWCCVVKHGLVTLVIVMILKYRATFQILFIISLYILCLEHHYSEDQ